MTKWIAEIGANHNQSLTRAVGLVETAHKCGFDAVKFQLFTLETLFHSSEISASPGVERLREAELPIEWLPILKAESQRLGLSFGLSIFSLEGLEIARPYLDFCKIASYELLWGELLLAASLTDLPIFLSTGMADEAEVIDALKLFRSAGRTNLTLMHCVSAYPAPAREANLSAIECLRRLSGKPVGWSDHTVDSTVVHRAIQRWGAAAVELHLDLDGLGMEGALGHCWFPKEAKALIEESLRWDVMDGDGRKRAMPSEAAERERRTDPYDGLRPLRSSRRG